MTAADTASKCAWVDRRTAAEWRCGKSRPSTPEAAAARRSRPPFDFERDQGGPAGALTWAQDVFSNSIATDVFPNMTDALTIYALTELEPDASASPVFDITASAIVHPFRYSDDEWIDPGRQPFSNISSEKQLRRRRIGSVYFVAPSQLRRRYGYPSGRNSPAEET